MKNLSDIQTVLQVHKQELMQKYGLKSIGIFGSFSRGEQTSTSDIDILIDYHKPLGIEFVDLADELESLLHRRVDLVSRNGIKQRAMVFIEKDLVYV